MKKRFLSLAALMVANSSLAMAQSAAQNTRFVDQNDPAGADPNAKSGNSYISDGGMQSAVGAGTMAKTAAIIGGSFSGVRNSGEIDGGRDLGVNKDDAAGLGLNIVPMAAAGRQAYLQ